MSSYHGERILSQWQSLRATLKQKLHIQLQGDSLDTASLVAVARYDLFPSTFQTLTIVS